MKKPIVAVQTALAPRGGSFLADPVTGALTPLFMPDCGMDPDAAVVAEIPATPAPDAENEESA